MTTSLQLRCKHTFRIRAFISVPKVAMCNGSYVKSVVSAERRYRRKFTCCSGIGASAAARDGRAGHRPPRPAVKVPGFARRQVTGTFVTYNTQLITNVKCFYFRCFKISAVNKLEYLYILDILYSISFSTSVL